MSDFARVFYPASGTDYAVPFPYQLQSEVIVEVGGAATTAFTWLNANTIRLSAAATGVVYIFRNTNKTTNKTVFSDLTTDLSADRNLENTQLLYGIEEAYDLGNDALGLGLDDGVNFDARGVKIVDLAPGGPALDDAVNYGQVASLITSALPSLANIQWVANVAALAAVVPPSSGSPTIFTRGRVSDEDGLAGFWEWVAGSVLIADNISVVAPNSGPAGRWVKIGIDTGGAGARLRNASGATLVRYVDPGGNDANSGLTQGTAMKTIMAAWNAFRDNTDINGGSALIQLTPGSIYGPQGTMVGDKTGGFGTLIQIAGDPTLVNPPQILAVGGGDACITFRDGAWAQLNGILLGSSGSGSTGVSVQQKALADFQNMYWAAMTAGFHIHVDDGGDANITGLQHINGNALAHWYLTFGAKLIVGSVTIDGLSSASAFTEFLLANGQTRCSLQAGLTFVNTGSFTGKQFDLSAQSMLQKNGGSPPPGSVGGVVDGTSIVF